MAYFLLHTLMSYSRISASILGNTVHIAREVQQTFHKLGTKGGAEMITSFDAQLYTPWYSILDTASQ